MDWSFQLYSAREFLPWNDVLETLSELGYGQVEGFGGVYESPAGFRALLDRYGLAMPTGHFSIEALEKDFGTVRRTAETLGIELVVCPWLEEADRPADTDGWRVLGKRLAAIGDRAQAAGLSFAWHNHDFEFAGLPDGSVPMTHLLESAPDIGWEADIAWIIRGGSDPHALMERYANRLVACHVKDIAPAGTALDEDGWTDVGHGTVDWRRLIGMLRAKTATRYFIIEHDNPGDLERFARRSIETVKTL